METMEWIIPSELSFNSTYDGMEYIRLLNEDAFILWCDKVAVIFQLSDNRIHVVKTESSISNVLQKNELVYLLDSEGNLNLLLEDNLGKIVTKLDTNIGKGIVCLKSVTNGFVTVVRAGEELSINLHQDGKQKRQKCVLDTRVSESMTSVCKLKICKQDDFCPYLLKSLMPNLSASGTDIVFAIVGNGDVFMMATPDNLNSKLIYYSDVQPVVNIVCFQDPTINLCSHIALVLHSGVTVLTSFKESTHRYDTVYLPNLASDNISLPVAESYILSGNQSHLWLSQFVMHDKISLVHTKLSKLDICFLCPIANQAQAIMLSADGIFYRLDPAVTPQLDDIDPSLLLAEIEKCQKQLLTIYQAIIEQDQLIHAHSLAARSQYLADNFLISLDVCDAIPLPTHIIHSDTQQLNNEWRYIFNLTIVNNTRQVFLARLWFLLVTINLGQKSFVQTVDLIEDFHRSPLKVRFPMQIEYPRIVTVQCQLVSTKSNTPEWMTINMGSIQRLDTLRFFHHISKQIVKSTECINSDSSVFLQDFLQDLATKNGVKLEAKALMDNLRLVHHTVNHNYSLRLTGDLSNKQIWQKILEDNNSIIKNDTLCIYVGNKLVTLRLSQECTHLNIVCNSVRVIHNVKDSLVSSLAKHMVDIIIIEENTIKNIERCKSALYGESESVNLDAIRHNWRQNVTSQLPL